jgi:hypothetical protein
VVQSQKKVSSDVTGAEKQRVPLTEQSSCQALPAPYRQVEVPMRASSPGKAETCKPVPTSAVEDLAGRDCEAVREQSRPSVALMQSVSPSVIPHLFDRTRWRPCQIARDSSWTAHEFPVTPDVLRCGDFDDAKRFKPYPNTLLSAPQQLSEIVPQECDAEAAKKVGSRTFGLLTDVVTQGTISAAPAASPSSVTRPIPMREFQSSTAPGPA